MKFHEHMSCGVFTIPQGHTGRQIDMTELIAAFSNLLRKDLT